MPAKVCPRCGAQYQNLKSVTCPQCFAVLVAVDEETADELAAARAEVERSPEFQQVKAEDDEKFKEQSFGACLGVVAITVVTLILGVVLIAFGAHRHAAHVAPRQTVTPPAAPVPPAEPLTTLPVAAATLEDVMPPQIGPYRRQAVDQGTVLTGTLTPLFHAVYLAPGGKPLDAYALPAGRPTTEQNEMRLGLTLASQVGGDSRPLVFFATEYWHYAALAAPGDTPAPAAFRDALADHFRAAEK